MTRLTSVQEAAFNAAGESALDLGFKIVASLGGTTEHPQYYAFCDHPRNALYQHRSLFSDHMPTLAEAVQNLCDKREEALNAPPSLTTAAEAIAAVKDAITESGTPDAEALIEKIEALPVEG